MKIQRYGWLLVLFTVVRAEAADEPDWLKQARAREAQPVAASDVRSEDGVLTARVPARLGSPVTGDADEYVLQFDVGSGNPVICEVMLEAFDIAGMLRTTASLSMDEISKAQGKVDKYAIESIDVGAWGAHPYISTQWLYRVESEQGPLVGGLKQAAVDMDERGLYCAHADLGYVETFRTIVRTLAETLQLKGASVTAPKFTIVMTAMLGKMPVGVGVDDVTVDADGDLRTRSRFSMLLPMPDGGVTTLDGVQVEWTTPDGAMLNGLQVSATNGSVETELRIERNDEQRWQVVGNYKGKPIEAVLDNGPPSSTYLQARVRREAMARPDPVGFETSAHVWNTSDPTRLLETRFRITGRTADGFQAREDLGPLAFDFVLDPATGWPVTAAMPVGPQVLKMQRVYQQGTP